jgi:hypothetical protein
MTKAVNTNMAVWEAVFKTDPAHTKGFKRTGGFSGTAIKPLYLIEKATGLWGPMGDRWGAEELYHVIEAGMVFIKARVWYPGACGEASVEHFGGDVLLKGEGKFNDEAFKMAFTDAIGKCLVQLGFSADVHMGLFDDAKYVSELKAEFADDSEGKPKEPALFDTPELRATFVANTVKAIRAATSLTGVKDVRALNQAKLNAMKVSPVDADVNAHKSICDVYNERFKHFQAQETPAKANTVDAAVKGAGGVTLDDEIPF